jgi:hypothetical protein
MEFDNRGELLHSILCLSVNVKIKKNQNNFLKREKREKNLQKITGNDVIKGDQLIYIQYKH